MKILVRNYKTNENGNTVCNYIWKKMSSINPIDGYTYTTEDGSFYNIGEILKVSGDFRLSKKSKYMICSNCGKVVREQDALKHYEESERAVNCAACDWMRVTDEKEDPKKIVKTDGTVITKHVGVAKCSKGTSSWITSAYESIKTVDKVTHCKYYKCRRAGLAEFPQDFLSENPNPTTKILTEKAVINSKNWKYMSKSDTGRDYCNSSGNVIAKFDTNGLLIKFILVYRGETATFYYSDRYDKFYTYRGEFQWRVNWNMISENSKARYQRQIRALYGIKG